MRPLILALFILALPFAMAQAQDRQDDAIMDSLKDAPILTENMEDMNTVVLQSLDKITARTHKFEVPVGETVRFGTIYILAQTCKKAPPIEQPESAAFLQIWQKKTPEEAGSNYTAADINKPRSEWVFSGWMFASSPALSSMDHPVYDVWVLDCKNTDIPSDDDGATPSEEEQDNTGSITTTSE